MGLWLDLRRLYTPGSFHSHHIRTILLLGFPASRSVVQFLYCGFLQPSIAQIACSSTPCILQDDDGLNHGSMYLQSSGLHWQWIFTQQTPLMCLSKDPTVWDLFKTLILRNSHVNRYKNSDPSCEDPSSNRPVTATSRKSGHLEPGQVFFSELSPQPASIEWCHLESS